MNWLEVNGACLRCELSGAGRTTLVLVHEMGGTLDSWDQVLPAVNATRRVLRYDFRGAGLSEKLRGAATWDQMAGDIKGLLDALGIEGKVALAGIAVGAGIAAHFATTFPDRAGALMLHGPATGLSGDRRQAMLDRAAKVEAEGMRSIAESSLAASYPPIVQHNAEDYRRFRARWLCNDPHSFAAINRMLAHEDTTDRLGRIACPTLVTAGTHDGLRPPSVIEPMARMIPGAEFLELNSGHFASMQTPGLVAQAIHGFLQSHGY